MENDLRYFEYPLKPPTKKLWVFLSEVHCFHISKHISISVLFFIISVSCFVVFAGFLKIIAPGVGF